MQMDRYIGVDAHAATCTLGVISDSGKRLKSIVVETNGTAIVEAVKLIPGRLHVCIEEGTQSEWLHELLTPHVEEVVVVVAPKATGAKDDQRDAWARAEELRTRAASSRNVYKTGVRLAALRSSVRAHRFAVSDVVRAKNRLKAVFLGRGLRADATVYDPERRQRWLSKLKPPYRQLAEMLGRHLDQVTPAREEAEAWLRKEAKAHPVIRILTTAPGMGLVRVAQLVAIVGTPTRFRAKRPFWSYCGLAVETRSSSDWRVDRSGKLHREQIQSTRGLTRKRQPLLKSVFKGAATTVIMQLPNDPLHARYQKMIEDGMKPALARLTLARQIASIVLSMWKHEEVYDPQRWSTSTAA
jgi:transposase